MAFHFTKENMKGNSKILKGQSEFVRSEARQEYVVNRIETKDKHSMHNTTLKTKASETRTLQKLG